MKYEIEKPKFSPITVTFDRQEEIVWLMGVLTSNTLNEAIRKVDPNADSFFDELHAALRTGDSNDRSYAFANKIDVEL